MDNWLGYALVVLAAAVFGASSIVIKYIYSTGLSPMQVLMVQNLVSMLLAWGWVLTGKKNAAVPVRLRLSMVAQGAVGGFFTSALFYTALASLGAALSTLLLFSYPAFVVAYEVLFDKYRISKYEKIALATIFTGLLLAMNIFAVKIGPISPWPLVMGLASAVTYAFMNVNGEKLLSCLHTSVVTAWSLTFSTLAMLIFFQPLWLADLSLSELQAILLVLGSVVYILPLILLYAGIVRIGAGIASIISTAEIPFTPLLAWLFLGETFSILQVVGGILIIAGIVILYYHRIE